MLPPVRIPVYLHQYLLVQVGNPGTQLVLRMRWDLNISYLYDSPKGYSTTYYIPKPGEPGQSSEIFYLSSQIQPLRLPVVYGQEDPDAVRDDTNDGVTFAGIIGLGPSSALWTYWVRYTISKFTLSLGFDDDIDALEGSHEVHSFDPYFTSLVSDVTKREFNYTVPLAFDLSEEFTLVPLAIFPNVSAVLKGQKRVSVRIHDNCTHHPQTAHQEIVAWLSKSSSVFTNTYGAKESSLRIAEKEGKSGYALTLGRIHTLGSFVLFHDMANGLYRVRQVFDTFPAVPPSQASQAFISLIAMLVWAYWRLLSWPSLYQWLVFAVSPRQKYAITLLKGSKLGSTTSASSSSSEQRSSSNREADSQQQPYRNNNGLTPALISANPEVFERVKQRAAKSASPVDMLLVTSALSMLRVLSIAVVYTSVWAFHSKRFSARLASMACVNHAFGEVFYWMCITIVGFVPFMITPGFVKRYMHAGMALMAVLFSMLVWISQLPDTTSIWATLAVGLLYSSIAMLRVWEWAFSCILRGSDRGITQRFIDSSNSSVLPRERNALPPRRHRQGSAYSAREVILLVLWVVLFAPFITVWTVVLNFLPLFEYSLPHNPARLYATIIFVIAMMFVSWHRTNKTLLQISEESIAEIDSEVYKIIEKDK